MSHPLTTHQATPALIRPALLVHEFALLDRARDLSHPSHQRFVALWQACGEGLGMNQPTPSLGVSLDFPTRFDVDTPFGLLAARKRPTGAAALYQAVIYRAHDTIGFTGLLAPNDQTQPWQELDRQWSTAAVGASAAEVTLGGVRVYLALVPAAYDQPQHIDAILAAIGAAIPGSGDGPWTQRWCRTADGFLVWEAPAYRPEERRLVVIGPENRERELDGWAWTGGGGSLGPLIRYLLHAAELRYEHVVYSHGQRFRPLRRDVDDAVDTLLELTGSTHPQISVARLSRADIGLGCLQAKSDGLATVITRLQQLARTVSIAAANMTAALPGRWPAGSAFAEDYELARWLRVQLRDDLAYLQATQERADRVRQLTGIAVQERLRNYQQRLTLLQTSIIGALLMALAAIQAFGYRLPLPGPMQAPVIAVLSGLALALPSAVLRWSRSTAEGAALGAVDLTAVALLGGAVGWLTTTLVSRLLLHHLVTWPWTALSGVLGAALAALLGWLRRRRSHGRDRP